MVNGRGRKARVLLVDDNPQDLRLLRFLLEEDGYEAVSAQSGRHALNVLQETSEPINLMILDVLMPHMDGFDLCRQIREQGDNLPVVFLSAKADPWSRIEGLRCGGDDFVGKPFDPNELMARVAAVLRRADNRLVPMGKRQGLRIGPIELDPERSRVKTSDGMEVALTPTEMKLLHCLMRNAGRVLTRDTLISQVWDYDYEGNDNTVDVYIRRLRRKVERNPDEPKFIVTVRGSGYLFHPEK